MSLGDEVSLGDAMRKAGLGAYAGIGEALENAIKSQFDKFYNELEAMRKDLIDAVKEAVKESIKTHQQSENLNDK